MQKRHRRAVVLEHGSRAQAPRSKWLIGTRLARCAWPAALVFCSTLVGQTERAPDLHEIAGVTSVVPALVKAFDDVDVLGLGERHGHRADSDLRIALVRHPEFGKKVRFVVVEFAEATHQAILDSYVSGEDVPVAELEKVWTTTSQTSGVWNSPVYAEFFAAVRDVNSGRPPSEQVRVLAGDPPNGRYMSRDAWAASLLEDQVIEKGHKALVVFGGLHLIRTEGDTDVLSQIGGGIIRILEEDYPGRSLVVYPLGGADPKYYKFEQALGSTLRPVLVSLGRSPYRDFRAKEFIGANQGKKRVVGRWEGFRFVPGGFVGLFEESDLKLSELADVCLYLGMGPEAEARVKATP